MPEANTHVEVPGMPTVKESVGTIVNALTGERDGPRPETKTPKDRMVFQDQALAEQFFAIAEPGSREYWDLVHKIQKSKFATGNFEQDVRNYLRLKSSVKSLLYLLGDADE